MIFGLREMGGEVKEGGTRDEFMRIFQEMDEDGDEMVSKDEFVEFHRRMADILKDTTVAKDTQLSIMPVEAAQEASAASATTTATTTTTQLTIPLPPPLFTLSSMYSYTPSPRSALRGALLTAEFSALHASREREANTLRCPWGAAVQQPVRSTAARACESVLGALYDEPLCGPSGSGMAPRAEQTPLEMMRGQGAGDAAGRMKRIITAWRVGRIRRCWSIWWRESFGKGGGEEKRSHSYSVVGVLEDAARDKADLAQCLGVIEELQHWNNDLSHQVKQLLLQTFSLKTAALTVCEASRCQERARGEEKVEVGGGGNPKRTVLVKGKR